MPNRATTPCPKCNRMLKQSGTLDVDGYQFPAFQCDECLINVDLMGEKTEVALTFVLKDGQPYDPASDDGRLHF